MKPHEILFQQILTHSKLKCTDFKSLRPGHVQKSVGAWSWFAKIENTKYYIGSQWKVKQLIKIKFDIEYNSTIGDYDITPT